MSAVLSVPPATLAAAGVLRGDGGPPLAQGGACLVVCQDAAFDCAKIKKKHNLCRSPRTSTSSRRAGKEKKVGFEPGSTRSEVDPLNH
jgi:hypothetical protein